VGEVGLQQVLGATGHFQVAGAHLDLDADRLGVP
jgi:hypothetical protein